LDNLIVLYMVLSENRRIYTMSKNNQLFVASVPL